MNEQIESYYQKLMDAFEEKAFQTSINQYRLDIELQLNGFIEWLSTKLTSDQKIFHSPESRIKSKLSFAEKLYRKDYINKWKLDGDKKSLQLEILKKLPDLIGFRITCYFMDDEEVIYKKLKEYYDSKRFSDIILDFSEGTTQKNGKPIYKVSGRYQDAVSFELQIKAATHNVWGEVEHRTIYKGRQYSINHQERQTITGEIFNILKASDQQLLALFKSRYTQKDLVCALFAELTGDQVKRDAKTELLAGHYQSFFDIFLPESKVDIWAYVSAALSNGATKYEKKTLQLDTATDVELEIIRDIKSAFLEHYLKVQHYIAQELYTFKNYDAFLLYMIKNIERCFSIEVDEESIEDDMFAEDEGGISLSETPRELVLNVLNERLPEAIKKGGERSE